MYQMILWKNLIESMQKRIRACYGSICEIFLLAFDSLTIKATFNNNYWLSFDGYLMKDILTIFLKLIPPASLVLIFILSFINKSRLQIKLIFDDETFSVLTEIREIPTTSSHSSDFSSETSFHNNNNFN
ncbi:hypothetical protein BpHYR1_019981 [Brachionus plicatilis]|uniref:Uncharacterized protein n=1 Tax=Brachionus plicatilis TaxID=10195 RepID=A0A3M7SBI6_BRAPC|nr:hypothetical protein BpHYR1_019981 [Brachionus plicatilis]